MNRLLILLLCLMLLPAASAHATEINLSMAASLKDALNEIADAFQKKHPGVRINRNTGGSGALAKQIENGAPADLFLSANEEWMNYLKAKGMIDQRQVINLAYNELVFAGRTHLKISSIQDLPQLERIAIGSPKSVPAGEYAMAAMNKAGINKHLDKKLIMARDARECLMYAERGEVDGGFVYRTDALLLARQAKILFTVPRELYGRVTYPAGLTSVGVKKAEALALLHFLQSPEALKTLERYGFASR